VDRETRIKRLRFRSWHRGTKEADLMVGGFFDRFSSQWDETEIAWYEMLMDEQDVDIMAWATGSGHHGLGHWFCRPAVASGRIDADRDATTRFHLDSPMTDISRITRAPRPLTLAGVPTGFLPWLMTDLARAAPRRAVFIATDEAEMRGVADTAHWFAPEVRVLTFPAWDCLPYDRASPSLRTTSERLATLSALQDKAAGPQLLVTTVNAASQRTLTPFRLRQLVARLAPGERIDRDDLAKLLQANGYVRSETVADAGDFAVRGSLVDLFPSGMDHAMRLDFFGDEIESVRTFDPADQRTIERIAGFTLLPASESLLDEESIKRFRSRYRETFGATATGDPLYQAVSEGRRLAGMDHWLPLIEDKLATLFDHIGPDDIIRRYHRARRWITGCSRRPVRGDCGLPRQPRSGRVGRPRQLSSASSKRTLFITRGMGRSPKRSSCASRHPLP